MGNNISSHRRPETESVTISKSSKIPKHLQPLKRKQTKKSSSTSSASTTEPKASVDIKVQNQLFGNNNNNNNIIENKFNNKAVSNPAKTIQVKYYDSDSLDRIYNDHSVSSPQLATKNEKKFKNGVANEVLPLPATQLELDRQRVQLYIMRWAFESRHLVPPIVKQKLFEGIRVLDVSCGPGLWLGHPVMDMAEDFCKSTFDSIDLSNLLPPKPEVEDNTYHFSTSEIKSNIELKSEKLTDNFTFTPHNVVKDGPLPFEDDTFDYVQQSQALLVYNRSDWKRIALDLKRVTKPGGYIQLLEIDLYPQPLGEIGGLWRDQVHQCVEAAADIPTRIPLHLDKVLIDAGLEDIETRFVTIPVGSWGLDIGVLWEQNVYGFLEAFAPYLQEAMQLSKEEYNEKRKVFLDEFKDESVRAFNNIYIAWGRLKELESI